MNLFPLQSPVSQMEAPTENPALRAFVQGLDAGKDIPTPAKALADAFTTGMEAYHGEVQNQQREEQNFFAIEANKLALQQRQADAQNYQADAQLEAEKIQAQRDKIAQETKERQEEDELIATLQSGDEQQLTEAVISDKYLGVFSRNPRLEEAAIKRAAPHMNEEYQDIFHRKQARKQTQSIDEKLRAKREETFNDAFGKFDGSDLVTDIKSRGGNIDVRELARDIDIIDPSEVVEKDGYVQLQENSNEFLRPPGYDPSKKDNGLDDPSRKKWARRRSNNQIVSRNVSKDDEKTLFAMRAAASSLGNTDINDSRASTLLKLARGQTPDVVEPKNSNTAPKTSEPQPTHEDLLKKMLSPKASVVGQTPLSLSQAAEELQKQPLIDASNRVSFTTSKEVPRLVANSLSIPAVAANKNIGLVKKYLDSAASDSSIYSKLNDRQELVKSLLLDSYPALSEEQRNSYDRVKEHNAQRNNRAKAIEKRAFDPRIVVPPEPLGGMQLVNSPEELYVAEESQRLYQRLDSIVSQMHLTAQNQLKTQSNKGLQRSNIFDAVNILKLK